MAGKHNEALLLRMTELARFCGVMVGMAEKGAVTAIGDQVEPFPLRFGYGHAGILCSCFCNRITPARA